MGDCLRSYACNSHGLEFQALLLSHEWQQIVSPNWWQLSIEVGRLSPRSSSRGITRADKDNKLEHICSSLMPSVEQSFKSSSQSELLKSKMHQQQKFLKVTRIETQKQKTSNEFFLFTAFSLSLVRVRFGDFGKLGCFRCQMVA